MSGQRSIEGLQHAVSGQLGRVTHVTLTPADLRIRLAAMKRARQAARQSKGMNP